MHVWDVYIIPSKFVHLWDPFMTFYKDLIFIFSALLDFENDIIMIVNRSNVSMLHYNLLK